MGWLPADYLVPRAWRKRASSRQQLQGGTDLGWNRKAPAHNKFIQCGRNPFAEGGGIDNRQQHVVAPPLQPVLLDYDVQRMGFAQQLEAQAQGTLLGIN